MRGAASTTLNGWLGSVAHRSSARGRERPVLWRLRCCHSKTGGNFLKRVSHSFKRTGGKRKRGWADCGSARCRNLCVFEFWASIACCRSRRHSRSTVPWCTYPHTACVVCQWATVLVRGTWRQLISRGDNEHCSRYQEYPGRLSSATLPSVLCPHEMLINDNLSAGLCSYLTAHRATRHVHSTRTAAVKSGGRLPKGGIPMRTWVWASSSAGCAHAAAALRSLLSILLVRQNRYPRVEPLRPCWSLTCASSAEYCRRLSKITMLRARRSRDWCYCQILKGRSTGAPAAAVAAWALKRARGRFPSPPEAPEPSWPRAVDGRKGSADETARGDVVKDAAHNELSVGCVSMRVRWQVMVLGRKTTRTTGVALQLHT